MQKHYHILLKQCEKLKKCGSGFRLYDSLNIKPTIWLVGAGLLSVSWPIGVQLVAFFCSSVSVVLLTHKESPGVLNPL